MSTQLLHSKLMPPRIHATVIFRPNLLARLNEGIGKKLTLISAPTGYGKTTLVSMWLKDRQISSAWVSLDESDNDPVRFWTYLISALRRLDANLGKTALAALATAQLPSFQSFLTPLINELEEMAAPGALILEDYQAITTPEIDAALTFFLQHKPDALQLIILSRSEPNLPLGILRARDDLLEINGSDLRFTRAETEAFLREMLKAEVSAEAIENLQLRTEGWPAGLRLASISLQNKRGEPAEQVIQSFSGSHRHVADYLIREVFESLSQSVQDFLRKTCFLNRLTGALCNAITLNNNGEAILEQLERENLFLVQLESGHGRSWYRYYPLFAESIQSLAHQQLSETDIQTIFERASDWYAHQQLLDDAIETALALGLFERAIGWIEAFIDIYSLNEMHTLTRWMERIPPGLTLEHPAVCMMYAQVILFTTDRFARATAARIEPYLQAARQIWQSQGDLAKVGTVLALRGMVWMWQGEFQKSLDAVYQALDLMPETEVFWRGVCLLNAAGGELFAGRMLSAQNKILEARALLGASQNIHGMLAATGMLSEMFYAQGEMDLCEQLNQQILVDAVGEDSMLDDQGEAHLRQAHVAYERNDLEAAEQHAAEAFNLAKQRANEILQAQAAKQIANIRASRGEAVQARQALKVLAAQLQSPLALTEIRSSDALLAVQAGDPVSEFLLSNPETLFPLKERQTFIRARLSRSTEVQGLLQPVLTDAIRHGRVRSQVEALTLIGLAQYAAGDSQKAAECIAQALAIGYEKGFRRIFLDEGEPMAALLRETLPSLNKRPVRLYATTLIHLLSSEGAASPIPAANDLTFIEPLSQQEMRVLKLLVAGLSNGEIANELVISTNTIKTHVKNIYRKLNINSREEARVIVKELKLL